MLGPVLETLIGGLMTGVLYSLVALGFVLIFKASGVFNFAQGAMVLFAALSFARLSEFMPLVIAFALSVLIMIALAYAIEFLVLRHLVNQEGIILFMATLGIAYFLEGFGQTVWGSDIYKISLGLPTNPIFILESIFPVGLLIDPVELHVNQARSAHSGIKAEIGDARQLAQHEKQVARLFQPPGSGHLGMIQFHFVGSSAVHASIPLGMILSLIERVIFVPTAAGTI